MIAAAIVGMFQCITGGSAGGSSRVPTYTGKLQNPEGSGEFTELTTFIRSHEGEEIYIDVEDEQLEVTLEEENGPTKRYYFGVWEMSSVWHFGFNMVVNAQAHG